MKLQVDYCSELISGFVNDNLKEYLNDKVNYKSRELDKMRNEASEKIINSQKYNEKYFNNTHKKPLNYQGNYVILQNFDTIHGMSKKFHNTKGRILLRKYCVIVDM